MTITKSIQSFVILFLLSCFLQMSCDNDDNSNESCQDIICTLELRRINVSVLDENQNSVALDSFEVVDIENGEDLTITLSQSEFEGAQEFGQYPLIEDGIFGLNQERELIFKGFKDGVEVVSARYTVKTDCCHVSLKSGDVQLTI